MSWKRIIIALLVILLIPSSALGKKRSKRGKMSLDEVTLSEINRTLEQGLRSGNMSIRSVAYQATAISSKPRAEIEATLKDGLKDPQTIVLLGVIEGMINRGMKGYDEALIKCMSAPELNWSRQLQPVLNKLKSKNRIQLIINALNAKALRGKNRIALEALRGSTTDAMAFLGAAQKAGGTAASLSLATLADITPALALTLYPEVIRRGSDEAREVVLTQSQKLPKDVDRKFLIPLLKNKNAKVRIATAKILAPLGNRDAARILIPEAMNEVVPVADRLDLLRRIQGAVDKSMLPLFGDLLAADADPALRGAVYGCYALSGDTSILGAVRADLAGTDGRARAAASRWLGTLGGPDEVPMLKELLVDGNSDVRKNAAFSLGEMRSLAMIPLLEQGLMDVSPEVKLETVRALAKVRNNEVAEKVQFLAFDRDLEVRKETLKILAESKHIATISTLENLLSDSDTGIRFDALIAIMNTDLEKGKTAFKRSLLWLKPHQVIELARRQGKDYVTYASIALQSRKEETRAAALQGLSVLDRGTVNSMLLSFRDSSRFPDIRRASYLAFARENWAEALPVFESWLTSVETPPSDLDIAFEGLEMAPASQRVIDALKAGFVLNEAFQARATLALLKITSGR